MENFLLPATIIRFGEYISFDIDDTTNICENVEYSSKAKKGTYIMAKDVNGNDFICNIRSNIENIDEKYINDFFNTKAESKIDKAFELKIKDSLEDDDSFNDEIEKIIEERDLSRKEAKTFEKEFIVDKIKEIALSEKLIKPGSIVRLPLSSGKKKKVILDGKELPIYDSVCLIKKSNGEISESGIYYVSQNRHGIPLKLVHDYKNKSKLKWQVNKDLVTVEEVITILNHGLRTIEKSDFRLYFSSSIKELKDIIEPIQSKYDKEDSIKNKDLYIDIINQLKEILLKNKEYIKELTIFLPTNIDKDYIYKLENSVLGKQIDAIYNLFYKNKNETKEDMEVTKQNLSKELYKYIDEERINIFATYNIIATYDSIESTTYGFLINNLKPSSIMIGPIDYNKFLKSDFINKTNGNEEYKKTNELRKKLIKSNKEGMLIL